MVRGEIFQLVQSLKELQQTYLPNHPTVIQEAKSLAESADRDLSPRPSTSDMQSAKYQEEALQTSFDQQHNTVLQQATRSADFDRVRTELSRIEKDLDIVESRINEVSLNQDAGSLNISIAQPAVPSPKPSHPSKLRTVFFGRGVGPHPGLALGCGLAVWREGNACFVFKSSAFSRTRGGTQLADSGA